MKKIVSILSVLFAVGILSVNAQCCAKKKSSACDSGQTTVVQNQTQSEVQAYYFHATRRCVTCKAVESVTQEALKEYYGEQVAFSSINRENEKDNPLIAKYKVSGQTLLIIKGDKVVNLTNVAFMNARTNPAKLKKKLKATIDSMI